MTINSHNEIKSDLGVKARTHYLIKLILEKDLDRTHAYVALQLMLLLEQQTKMCIAHDFEPLYEKLQLAKKYN